MKRIIFFTILLIMAPVIFAQNWTLKDSGAGLVIVEDNYDKPLKIIRRNTIWDLKELHEKGALDGKYNGNQLFASWIQGPEIKEFLNSKAKPAWMSRYRITYPDGKVFESEPGEFTPSGYSYFGISKGNYTEGVWKIEWFVLDRDRLQATHVATSIFQTTWGRGGKKDSFSVKASEPD